MTPAEEKRLKRLEEKHKKLQQNMLEIQAAYTKAVRAGNIPDAKLRKMADKGFKAEMETLKALDEKNAYLKKLKRKGLSL
jgi:ribonuclease D